MNTPPAAPPAPASASAPRLPRLTTLQRAALGLALAVPAATVLLGQGPLTPPGAPAPTMKTLDQVQPRIPLSAATTPGDADSTFLITQPGSYYLTGNLTGVSNRHGIEIQSAFVTIDLMGFTLDGSRATPSTKAGIFCPPDDRFSHITIQNGFISGWGGSGIFLGNSLQGVETVGHCTIRNVTSSGNSSAGIVVVKDSLVEDCVCDNNPSGGISLAGSRSIARRNLCRGNGNPAAANNNGGISLGSLNSSDCVIEDNVLINNKTGLLIVSASTNNLYLRNKCAGNTTANYLISAGNRGGICVLPPVNSAAISGSTSSTGSGTTDPFANLSY